MKAYPRDWRSDIQLGKCRLESRGLWWELLGLMHEGTPYGHLGDDSGPWTDVYVARTLRITPARYKTLLTELEINGVPSKTPNGTIFSRRMVRDEELRVKRASGGPLSVNHPHVQPKKGYPSGPIISPDKGTLDGVLDGHPCTPVSARADSDSVYDSSAKETSSTEEIVLLDSQLVGLQALYADGGVPFNERDNCKGVQDFISRSESVRLNICKYVAYAFVNKWPDPAHTKRFVNLMEDGDGDKGVPFRKLPAVVNGKSQALQDKEAHRLRMNQWAEEEDRKRNQLTNSAVLRENKS